LLSLSKLAALAADDLPDSAQSNVEGPLLNSTLYLT